MTRTKFVLLAAGGSLALLMGALMFQAFGYAPCKLCLWQRWPHVAAVAIGIIFLIRPTTALLYLGALSALLTSALGLYHTGVERGWWPGPDTCSSNGDFMTMTPAELLTQINNAPLIRCDDVAWDLFTLSMASWNGLASLALVGVWLLAARRT